MIIDEASDEETDSDIQRPIQLEHPVPVFIMYKKVHGNDLKGPEGRNPCVSN